MCQRMLLLPVSLARLQGQSLLMWQLQVQSLLMRQLQVKLLLLLLLLASSWRSNNLMLVLSNRSSRSSRQRTPLTSSRMQQGLKLQHWQLSTQRSQHSSRSQA